MSIQNLSLVLAAIMAVDSLASEVGVCANPVRAILDTLQCVSKEVEDADCAAAGYSSEFIKLHNGVDTHTNIDGPEFWQGAFRIADLSLNYNHIRRVGPNKVSIRYVESVDIGLPEQGISFPTIMQHEHALVTVDNNCKMVLWDQYGDNKEQTDVDDTVKALLEKINQPSE